MKLERIHESTKTVVALGGGLGLAIACGYFVGNGEAKLAFLIVVTIAVVAFLLIIRQEVWMLIPASAALGGKVVALPLPFTVAQIGILIAFGMYLALKALKVNRFKPKIGIVEVWMLIMIGYVTTVFLRNPAGVEALGSDRVGGKPYVDVIIAWFAYWVLARTVVTAWQARFVPLLNLIGESLNSLLNYIAYRFAWAVGPMASVYSGIAAAENMEGEAGLPEEGGRLTYLKNFGGDLMAVACSYWRPFTIINPMYFWRFVVFAMAFGAILLSGFRSNLFSVFQMFLVSSYFRRGMSEVMRACVVGVAFLGVIVILQGNVIDLPLPAQRALSFLPGKWEHAAKDEAEASTEWRVTMWKAMLEEDKYIENKWLGDGFGFTHRQLEIMAANSHGSNGDQRENLMISGGVHSGPISAIRFVGYVGLAIFLVLLVLICRRAIQLIWRAKGTPFFPLALFYGIPLVWFPFNFVFVFGGYEGDLPSIIIAVGLQRLLENSLEAYEAGQKKSSPEVIQPPKPRSVPQFMPVGQH